MQASLLFKNLVSSLTGLYDKNEAASIARIVFEEKLNINRTDLALDPLRQINKKEEDKMERLFQKLLTGSPIQQILGHTDFYGLKIKVNKNVLIPRPETEELVQLIINENKKETGLKVLDIGTGSGCISIVLACGLKNADLTGIDISNKALRMARMNAKLNDVEIQFKERNILEKKTWHSLKEFDIIVSNPPYVTESEQKDMHIIVLNHDPHLALFVPDNDPLRFYEKISDMALSHLSPGGKIYFEINEAFGKNVKNMLESKGFTNVLIKKDLNGKDRFVSGILV